jgi:hypothetical protein
MAAIKVNAPISQTGTVGLLLWMRRDLPRAYLTAVKSVPAVAAFETALRKSTPGLGCCRQLGDDSIDFSVPDTSAFDTSVLSDPTFSDPVLVSASGIPDSSDIANLTAGAGTIDTSALDTSIVANAAQLDTSLVMPTIPQLPAVAPSAPATGSFLSSVGSTASAIGSGIVAALPSIAKIAQAAAPVAITAMQISAAKQGISPLQTGYFNNPAGGQYLAGVSSPYPTLGFSASLPWWVFGLGGVGLLFLLRR